MTTPIIQILTGTIGTLGFGILFNIRQQRMVAATIGGFLSWSIYLLAFRFIPNEPLCYFIASLLTALYSEVMARLLKSPTTTFITTALVPLIPGGSLYYTMAYAFESDLTKFLERAVYTLQLASALALGIIVSSTITKLYFRYKTTGRVTENSVGNTKA